jgi:hypothetical protein
VTGLARPRFLNSLAIFPISQPVQWLSAAAGSAIQYVWAPTGPDDATTCRSRLHWKGLQNVAHDIP